MFMQIDIPRELSKELMILKAKLDLPNKQEVVLYILEEYFKEHE